MAGGLMRTVFYGWWMVAACLVVAVVAWALGLFGSSVYLHAVTQERGWSIGLVSSAITLFYLIAAGALMLVGGGIDRFGPRPVIALGALLLAGGVAAVGQVSQPWHVYAAFLVMGLGWACLSTTGITTTLAPWFERHQGRAVSTALMGASIGGMIGVPALLFGIDWLGFTGAMTTAAIITLVLLLPLALFVLRHRPQDMGLLPDGEPRGGTANAAPPRRWRRADAMRTAALRSVTITFGIGLMVQIGFLTHHVSLVAPTLGEGGAAATVTATAITAFLGRLALARFADRMDVRLTAAGMLVLAALCLTLLALFPTPVVLVVVSALYGVTVGNVTTLSPIIVRREFGAASFGAVYGLAATAIQLVSAMGPGFFGVLRDAFGGYGPPLLIAAVLDLAAAAVVIIGGRKTLPAPA